MGLPVVQKLWTPREAHTKKTGLEHENFLKTQRGTSTDRWNKCKRRNLLVQGGVNEDGENTCYGTAILDTAGRREDTDDVFFFFFFFFFFFPSRSF